jgi:hypothetical protein
MLLVNKQLLDLLITYCGCWNILHYCNNNCFALKEVSLSGNSSDLYLGSAHLKSQLDTDYTDNRLHMVFISPPGKGQDNISYQTTSTSVHIPSNNSFTDHTPQSELLTASSNYKYINKNSNIINIARVPYIPP